jgi:hypothetical protein
LYFFDFRRIFWRTEKTSPFHGDDFRSTRNRRFRVWPKPSAEFQKRAKNSKTSRETRAQIGVARVWKLSAKKWSKSTSTQKWSSPRYLAGQTAFSVKKYFPVKTRGEKSIYPKYSRDETGIDGSQIWLLIRRVNHHEIFHLSSFSHF